MSGETDSKKPKMPKPAMFKGSKDMAETWLQEVRMYCILEDVGDEDNQVAFALLYISMEDESKAKWFKKETLAWYVDLVVKEKKPVKWEAFEAKFRKEFISTQTAEEAEVELEVIQQGTDSIQDFTQKFKDLVHRSGVESDLVHRRWLRRAVKPALREKLSNMYPQPKTLDETITALREIQTNWELDQSLKSKTSTFARNPNTTWRRPFRTGSNRSFTPKIPFNSKPLAQRISAANVDQSKWQFSGECYNCVKKGHMARNCSEPPKEGGFGRNNQRTIREAQLEEIPEEEEPEDLEVARMGINDEEFQEYYNEAQGF